MKKRALIVVILFLYIQPGVSQEMPKITPPSDADNGFGNVFPVSPEASDLFRYSKTPLNHTSGQTNVNIPIYTINRNGFSWPISLSHHHSGLVLEKAPTRVGLGWSMVANAVISREVRVLPDEAPNGYYGINSKKASVIDPYVNSNQPISQGQLEGFINNTWDSEPDIYHVSIGGISFSFKVGDNNDVFLLSKQNHKVSFTQSQIIVTSSSGEKYFFSDIETSSRLGEYDDIDGTFGNGHTYTSSWYLSRIQLTNNENIYFNYISIPQTENYSFWGTSSYDHVGGIIDDPYAFFCGENFRNRQGFIKTFIDKKMLSLITFKDGSVDFGFEDHDFYKRYTSVTIKNKVNDVVDEFEFIYDNTPRPLLEKIEKNNINMYSFEYLNTNNIPDFVNDSQEIPTATDWWGYYNGENDNESITAVPVAGANVNKNTSSRHALIGSLKEITYPTGGSSTFHYESNQKEATNEYLGSNTGDHPPFNRRLRISLLSEQSVNKSTSFSYTFTEPTYAQISHNVLTYTWCEVKLSMGKEGSCSSGLYGNYMDTVDYLDCLNSDCGPERIHEFCPAIYVHDVGDGVDSAGDPARITGNSDGTILIEPGTYNFFASINGESGYNKSKVNLEIKFFKNTGADGNELIEEENQMSKVGGVRVRSIIDCDGSEDSECIKRSFDYDNEIDLGMGVYSYDTQVSKSCPFSSGRILFAFRRTLYNYKSFTNVNFNAGVPIFYKSVKESVGRKPVHQTIVTNYDFVNDFPPDKNDDNSFIVGFLNGTQPKPYTEISRDHDKNGFTHYKYDTPNFDNDTSFPFTPQIGDITMSRLNTIEHYKYTSDEGEFIPDYSLASKTDYNYSQFRDNIDGAGNSLVPNYPMGLRVDRKIIYEGHSLTIPWEDVFYSYHIIKYGELNNKFLTSDETLTRTNSNGSFIESSVNYIRDSNGTLKKQERLLNEGAKFITEYTYPNDLVTPDIAEQELITKNRISSPIKTETTVSTSDENGITELSKTLQRTNYKDFGNNLILPETIQTLKGEPTATNTLEPRIIYHDYDDFGNPLEVSKADGTHIVYIWGYNHSQPIAKIENATYAQLLSYIPNLQTKSNTDTHRSVDTIAENGVKIYANDSEGNLREALDGLRDTLPNALVTTYTYDPLIGVTSMTDPRGSTIYYNYDAFNRLKHVKDQDGNILSKNDYNYKN